MQEDLLIKKSCYPRAINKIYSPVGIEAMQKNCIDALIGNLYMNLIRICDNKYKVYKGLPNENKDITPMFNSNYNTVMHIKYDALNINIIYDPTRHFTLLDPNIVDNGSTYYLSVLQFNLDGVTELLAYQPFIEQYNKPISNTIFEYLKKNKYIFDYHGIYLFDFNFMCKDIYNVNLYNYRTLPSIYVNGSCDGTTYRDGGYMELLVYRPHQLKLDTVSFQKKYGVYLPECGVYIEDLTPIIEKLKQVLGNVFIVKN